jgi:predicted Zn-dependent peptidase
MDHTVERVRLSNQAEGLLIDIPAAAVTSYDIIFRAGDYLSPKDKTDTAHIMEHLVLGANKRYPTVKKYSREFSKYGAYNNAYTGDYHMGYDAECAATESYRILDLLFAAIEEPLFTEHEFKAEMGNVDEELKMRRNYHESELSLNVQNALGLVPLPFTERIKQLPNIYLQDIKEHYTKTHTTSNMRFIIAGPLNRVKDKLIGRIENSMLPVGDGLFDLPNEKPINMQNPLVLTNNYLENVFYRWEVVLPLLDNHLDRDSMLMVMETLFSGFNSKVFGRLRELGLAYGMHSSLYDTKNNSILTISGQVQAANIDKVATIIQQEINKIASKGVTTALLKELQKRTIGSLVRANQTASSISNWYNTPFTMFGIADNFGQLPERLMSITSFTMMQAADRLLKSDVNGMGFMHNPKDKLDAQAIKSILIGR